MKMKNKNINDYLFEGKNDFDEILKKIKDFGEISVLNEQKMTPIHGYVLYDKKLEIKSIFGNVLYTYEADNPTIKDAVEKAVKENVSLRFADLKSANLRDANLRGADMSDVNFSSANLMFANFSNANLQGAHFDNAYVINTNFSNANLFNANLGVNSDVELRKAKFNSHKKNEIKVKKPETKGDAFILKEEVYFVLIWAAIVFFVFIKIFSIDIIELNYFERWMVLCLYIFFVLWYFLPVIRFTVASICLTIYEEIIKKNYNKIMGMYKQSKIKDFIYQIFVKIKMHFGNNRKIYNIIIEYIGYLISLPISFYISKIIGGILLGRQMYNKGKYTYMAILLICIFTIFLLGVIYKLIKDIKNKK